MGYSANPNHVFGMIFNERGKWKYNVCLDYSAQDLIGWKHWDLAAQARRALATATASSISGVTFSSLPARWMLVVPEPRAENAFPICVIQPPDGVLSEDQEEDWLRGYGLAPEDIL